MKNENHIDYGDVEFLPAAILVFAREKINASSVKTKKWYSRFLKIVPPRRQTPKVHIQEYAGCDFVTNKCSGSLLNEWLVIENRVIRLDEQKTLEVAADSIVQYMNVTILKFFATGAGDKYVVNVIEPSKHETTQIFSFKSLNSTRQP